MLCSRYSKDLRIYKVLFQHRARNYGCHDFENIAMLPSSNHKHTVNPEDVVLHVVSFPTMQVHESFILPSSSLPSPPPQSSTSLSPLLDSDSIPAALCKGGCISSPEHPRSYLSGSPLFMITFLGFWGNNSSLALLTKVDGSILHLIL